MYSNGQKLLFEHGIKQATCFHASLIEKEVRIAWTDSFSKFKHRGIASKISDSTIFLVLSQNCDIAAYNDGLESAIELLVCKPVKPKQVFHANMFAISSRKLQFQHGEQWYEASSEYIVTVDKGELLSIIESHASFSVFDLSKEYSMTIPVWRANRYYRTGLPNKFNDYLAPILAEHIEKIESAASVEHTDYKSYIRAMYVRLDNLDEAEKYSFELFSLLRCDVNDTVMSNIQQTVENMAEELSISSGFTDNSTIYADRENNTMVSFLNDFLRLNMDHHSLSQGDDDIGPATR